MAARATLGEVVPLHPHVISGRLGCLSGATFSSIKGAWSVQRICSPQRSPSQLPPRLPAGPPPPLRSFQRPMALALPSATPLFGMPLGRGWHARQVAGKLESPNPHTSSSSETSATGTVRHEKMSRRQHGEEDTLQIKHLTSQVKQL